MLEMATRRADVEAVIGATSARIDVLGAIESIDGVDEPTQRQVVLDRASKLAGALGRNVITAIAGSGGRLLTLEIDAQGGYAPVAAVGTTAHLHGAPSAELGWMAATQEEAEVSLEVERARGIEALMRKASLHRPLVVVVANPAGGSGKTMTAAMLAAALGRANGGAVVVESTSGRGTLGSRIQLSEHRGAVADLARQSQSLRSFEPNWQVMRGSLSHAQGADVYDVVLSASRPFELAEPLSWQAMDEAMLVLQRFWSAIVIDAGADERSEQWRRALDWADLLVVPSRHTAEHAEAGRVMLEGLTRSGRNRDALLAREAVAVIGDAEHLGSARSVRGLTGSSRRAVTVPFDQGLQTGSLSFSRLAPSTQVAWMKAASYIVDGSKRTQK